MRPTGGAWGGHIVGGAPAATFHTAFSRTGSRASAVPGPASFALVLAALPLVRRRG